MVTAPSYNYIETTRRIANGQSIVKHPSYSAKGTDSPCASKASSIRSRNDGETDRDSQSANSKPNGWPNPEKA